MMTTAYFKSNIDSQIKSLTDDSCQKLLKSLTKTFGGEFICTPIGLKWQTLEMNVIHLSMTVETFIQGFIAGQIE